MTEALSDWIHEDASTEGADLSLVIESPLLKPTEMIVDEGETARVLALTATLLKEDFQSALAAQRESDREVLEAQLREDSVRKIFRVFGMLDGEESSAREFSRTYKAVEEANATENREHRMEDREHLMDVLDVFQDHPAVRTIDIFRKTSNFDKSATRMLRSTLVLLEQYENVS